MHKTTEWLIKKLHHMERPKGGGEKGKKRGRKEGKRSNEGKSGKQKRRRKTGEISEGN